MKKFKLIYIDLRLVLVWAGLGITDPDISISPLNIRIFKYIIIDIDSQLTFRK